MAPTLAKEPNTENCRNEIRPVSIVKEQKLLQIAPPKWQESKEKDDEQVTPPKAKGLGR